MLSENESASDNGEPNKNLDELWAKGVISKAALTGRKEELIAFLRLGKELTPKVQAYLADYLEGKLSRKRGRTRTREHLILEKAAEGVDRNMAVLQQRRKQPGDQDLRHRTHVSLV